MPRKVPPGSSGAAVSFHDPPPDSASKARYKEIIARAKSRDRSRPGDLEGTPKFEDVNTSWDAPMQQTQLSDKTAAGIQAVAEATAAERSRQADSLDGILDKDFPEQRISAAMVDEDVEEEELSEDERLRAAIEDRIKSKIDIGQYLMNGEALQRVPIIPKKLIIRFRTVSDLEECYVDSELSKEGDMTARAFLRRANEWALAFHIAEVNGVKWPAILDGDGTISDKSVKRRLGHVRKLSSPIFSLISKNLAWFLERVQNTLTVEALGNG